MQIAAINKAGSHRTGGLAGLTIEQINDKLGFQPNIADDPEKVTASWGFAATDDQSITHECGIWDYKGSARARRFSTYGPKEVFDNLFSVHYHHERD